METLGVERDPPEQALIRAIERRETAGKARSQPGLRSPVAKGASGDCGGDCGGDLGGDLGREHELAADMTRLADAVRGGAWDRG